MQTIKDTKVVLQFLKELPHDQVIENVKKLTAMSNQSVVKEQRIFRSTQPLQVSQDQLYTKLIEQQKSLGEDIPQEIINEMETLVSSLQPKYQLGDELLKIEGVEKITFAEDYSFIKEETDLEIEKGVVYLIHFWEAMNYCQQDRICEKNLMQEKNTEWEGKVKIIGLSADYETEAVTKMVKQRKCKSIQHYRFLNSENALMKKLSQQVFSLVLLINKQGQFNFIGDPSEINLEQRINELIKSEFKNEIQQENDAPQPQEPQEILTKEEFKVLKQQLNIIQTALNQVELEGIIKVVLEKINHWKYDGSKQAHKRAKLILSYDIDVKDEPKLNSFLENYWNQIPENLKTVGKLKIRDSIKLKKNIEDKFQETYAALGVNISYISIYNISLKYNPIEHSFDVTKTQQLITFADHITVEQYDQGMNNLQKFTRQLYDEATSDSYQIFNILTDIKDTLRNYVILKVGQQFQPIPNYKKWGTEEFTTIEHQPGQVLVVIYGADWYSQEIMENTTLLKQEYGEKFGQTVRFVQLSLVLVKDAKELQQINQESLKTIELYFPEEDPQSDRTLYDVRIIPHCIIVDKFGTIREIAQLYNFELVKELVNEQAPPEKQQNRLANITQDSVDKVLEIFESAETKEKLNKVDKLQIIQLDVQFEQILEEGQVKFKVPSLNLFCRDSQLEAVDFILKKVFELIPQNDWKINKTILNTFSVPYPGSNCSLCNKDILNEAQQYYSPFKKVHLCVECAEFDDKTKKGSDRYKCTDNLVFINGPLTDLSVLENIDYHKIGKNLQLQEGEEGSQCHPMMCNGCGQGTEGPRYIAVSARPGKYRFSGYVDYCQNCFVELKNKESEKAQAIIQKNAGDGMVKDSLLVRILFSHEDYRDF